MSEDRAGRVHDRCLPGQQVPGRDRAGARGAWSNRRRSGSSTSPSSPRTPTATSPRSRSADLDPDVQAALEEMGAEVSGLFNEDDLMAAAEELEPNSSAALLVWEDLWATRLAECDPRRRRRPARPRAASPTRSSSPPASGRLRQRLSTTTTRRIEMPMMRQRPRTDRNRGADRASRVGVAGRVQHRQQQKWAAQEQEQYAQQAPAGARRPPPRRRRRARLRGRAREARAASRPGSDHRRGLRGEEEADPGHLTAAAQLSARRPADPRPAPRRA